MRARVRRQAETGLSVGEIRAEVSSRRAWRGDRELDLSAKEFDLLVILMRHAGSVVSRERIMSEVWDPNWFGPTRTLDVHVSSLRRKLSNATDEVPYLTTVRGIGFRFELSSGSEAARPVRPGTGARP